MKTAESADEFLAFARDFQLGALHTEQSHPLTVELSRLCASEMPAAVAALKSVDVLALETMAEKLEPVRALTESIAATWADGGRVFLAGCGATGRLSLSLEVFCREGLVPKDVRERVIGFMAGGDAALIRSIEGFEDFPEYGARQLRDLGFGAKDLLIASTEGGETPWVIGVTEEAQRISERAPWFVYCNPDELLCRLVERSRRVLEAPAIQKWNLAVGPMGIAGSTRMEASTVLEYGIGLALEIAGKGGDAPARLASFKQSLAELSWDFMTPFVEREASIYERGHYILYETEDFGVSVLTDTTERAPTFSLAIFEHYAGGATSDPPSLCYVCLPGEATVEAAWRRLLRREPRCLDWPADLPATQLERLRGYDISVHAAANRRRACGEAKHHRFAIGQREEGLVWQLDEHEAVAVPTGLPFLENQICLKLLLNAHSTLVMGRLGRYEGNLMTFVKPSNNKLIDRAIRYVQTLHRRATGEALDYGGVCRELFRQRERLGVDEPIVLKTLAALNES